MTIKSPSPGAAAPPSPLGRGSAPSAKVQLLSQQGSAFARDKKKYAAELKEYFAGKRATFTSQFDLVGTDFQKSVWKTLQSVPFGTTITYGELAKKVGRPTAIRAVATAVGKNPVGIVIPCHRIVPASGAWPGKFAWGSDLKKWLLDYEKAQKA